METANVNCADHYIKHRCKDEKRMSFLTISNGIAGGTTYLRFHAARFTKNDAIALAKEAVEDNPDFLFQVVPMNGDGENLTFKGAGFDKA